MVGRENGEVLAPTRLRASDGALGRKVFEMLQHGASCGSWVFGLLEALTASENRLIIATVVDMGNPGLISSNKETNNKELGKKEGG